MAHEYKLSLYNYNIYKSRKYDTPRLESILKNCKSIATSLWKISKGTDRRNGEPCRRKHNIFCARKQNSSLESSHNTADCNFPLWKQNARSSLQYRILCITTHFTQIQRFKLRKPFWPQWEWNIKSYIHIIYSIKRVSEPSGHLLQSVTCRPQWDC